MAITKLGGTYSIGDIAKGVGGGVAELAALHGASHLLQKYFNKNPEEQKGFIAGRKDYIKKHPVRTALSALIALHDGKVYAHNSRFGRIPATNQKTIL